MAGFRLRNAFNHFVFIDVLDDDNLRSLRGGEPGSALPKNSSFCDSKKKKKTVSKIMNSFQYLNLKYKLNIAWPNGNMPTDGYNMWVLSK